MIYPSLANALLRVDNSRYTLVIVVSKRARQISEGAPLLTNFVADKPVTLALHEIVEGKIRYVKKEKTQN